MVGIFDHDLWAPDEPRAAELGREFLDHGSWAVPTLSGEPFLEKPPLVYWTIAASLKIFGATDWAARVPAVLFAWGTLLFAALLAEQLYGKDAAEATLLVLGTNYGFLVVTHHLEADAGLLLFVTATAYFLWRAIHGSSRWYGAAAVAAEGAFFSKGIIGLVFPGLLFITWMGWMRTPREILRARLWLWLPLMAIPIAFWMFRIASVPGCSLLRTFLYENHLQRFTGARGELDRGHLKPLWYYFIQLPLWFLPWTLVTAVGIRRAFGRPTGGAERFLLSWWGAGLLFLCVAGTKRAVYAVPLLPPLAILTGELLNTLPLKRWLVPAGSVCTLILAITWSCLVPRLNDRFSDKQFYARMAGLLHQETRLYAFDVDETARAAAPFYMGRRFRLVASLSEIPPTDPDEREEIVVLTQDVRGKDWHSRLVSAHFPHLWLSMPEDREHRMRLFSNVELR